MKKNKIYPSRFAHTVIGGLLALARKAWMGINFLIP
jgi:hypothetical protein